MKRFGLSGWQGMGALALVWLLLVSAGCVSKSKARLEAQRSFIEGQQQAIAAQQQMQAGQQPAVWFRGLVRNTRVPWSEGLTLSHGLAAAEYTGVMDPSVIVVIRQGQVYRVDPKRLLRGQEDPELQPGDIVEPRP